MNSKRPVNPSPARRLVAAVTASRFVLAVPLTVSKPFSTVFWLCYALGMASDALDGPLARALRCQSDSGARLDSLADLALTAALLASLARTGLFTGLTLWLSATAGLVRLTAYAVGWRRFHTFAAIHTVLNKITGALLAALPALYALFGCGAGIFIAAAAVVSSAQELLLICRTETLERDRKWIWLTR